MHAIDRRTPLAEIDPAWAWSAWEPSDTEAWDLQRAAQLYRRAAFCATPKTLRAAVEMHPQAAVDGLFPASVEQSPELAAFEADSQALAVAVKATGDAQQLSTWWLHRMLNHPRPLVEKQTLFLHGHFATGAEKVLDVDLMFQQNQLLRQHALGDFKAMVHGVAKDPAMLIYLDSTTNRKAHANENFARELMELFCLGEGNYTEADVQELARCFTGWEIRREQFKFNRYQHDNGPKQVLGHEVESGEQAIDVVLDQPSLPYFIAGKLFRFFVCDEPAPPPELLRPLADQFTGDQLSVAGMLRTILGSRLLLSDWSAGRKVRSPVELAIGFLTTLEGTANLYQLAERLREIGQAVFYPPNVKGWDGGRAWINSSTLVGRANLIHQLLRDEKTRFAGQDLQAVWRQLAAGGDTQKFLASFRELFLATELTPTQQTGLVQAAASQSGAARVRELLSLLAAMPQFQLA